MKVWISYSLSIFFPNLYLDVSINYRYSAFVNTFLMSGCMPPPFRTTFFAKLELWNYFSGSWVEMNYSSTKPRIWRWLTFIIQTLQMKSPFTLNTSQERDLGANSYFWINEQHKLYIMYEINVRTTKAYCRIIWIPLSSLDGDQRLKRDEYSQSKVNISFTLYLGPIE